MQRLLVNCEYSCSRSKETTPSWNILKFQQINIRGRNPELIKPVNFKSLAHTVQRMSLNNYQFVSTKLEQVNQNLNYGYSFGKHTLNPRMQYTHRSTVHNIYSLVHTTLTMRSAPTVAWKWIFRPEIMKDQPTNQPTDRPTNGQT